MKDIWKKIEKTRIIDEEDFIAIKNYVVDNINNKKMSNIFNIEFINIINFLRRKRKYKKNYTELINLFDKFKIELEDKTIESQKQVIDYLFYKLKNGVIPYEICKNILKQFCDENSYLSKILLNPYSNHIESMYVVLLLKIVFMDLGTYIIDDISNKCLDESSSYEKSKLNEVNIIIKKYEDDSLYGLQSDKKNQISISEKKLLHLNKYDLTVLLTLFHEITHSMQLLSEVRDMNKDLFNLDKIMNEKYRFESMTKNEKSKDFGYIDFIHYQMKKESKLQELYPKFYKDNYKIINFEIHAEYNSLKLLEEYSKELNLDNIYLNNTIINIQEESNKLYILLTNKEKKVKFKDNIYSLSELFDSIVNEKFLKLNPIFLIEYNEDGTRKNKKQLLNEYNDKKLELYDDKYEAKLNNLYDNLLI